MKKLIGLALAAGMIVLSHPAWAVVYKNPAHPFSAGNSGIGFSLATATMEFETEGVSGSTDFDIDVASFNFSLGLGDGGALGFHAGVVESCPDDPNAECSSGPLGGLSFRHNLSPGSEDGLRLGYFVAYRIAFVEDDAGDSEADITQFDAGFGGGLSLSEPLDLYGGVVFTQTDVTTDVFGVGSFDSENSNNLGIFLGIEVQPSQVLMFGIEVHAVTETAIAFYMDWRI